MAHRQAHAKKSKFYKKIDNKKARARYKNKNRKQNKSTSSVTESDVERVTESLSTETGERDLRQIVLMEVESIKSLIQKCRASKDKNLVLRALQMLHECLGCKSNCEDKPFAEHFSPRTLLMVNEGLKQYEINKSLCTPDSHERRNLTKRAILRKIKQDKLLSVGKIINLEGINNSAFPVYMKCMYHQLLEEEVSSNEIYIKLITGMREHCASIGTHPNDIEAVSQQFVRELFIYNLQLLNEKIMNMKPQTAPNSWSCRFVRKECELQAMLRMYTLPDQSDDIDEAVENTTINEILWLLFRVQFYDVGNNGCRKFIRETLFDQFIDDDQFKVNRSLYLAILFVEMDLELPPELEKFSTLNRDLSVMKIPCFDNDGI